MNKLQSGLLLVACISGALFMSVSAVAHEKVVVIPLHKNSAKIGNNTSPCNASTAGVLRWTGSIFEGCNGTEWTLLSPVPTVYSSGHEWMARNLGAGRVATGPTDSEAYGDLYQWGRYADGHEKPTSLTTTTQSADNVPGHGKFIRGATDWRNPQNANLWQASGLNNPCPPGFRLPTSTEWSAEVSSWGTSDAAGAYASPLKLVLAGLRIYASGEVNTDTMGGYWSSSVSGSNSSLLYFNSNEAAPMDQFRAYGFSVRCLKD